MILLDVGPRMHPHLEHVARAAADFLTSKVHWWWWWCERWGGGVCVTRPSILVWLAAAWKRWTLPLQPPF